MNCIFALCEGISVVTILTALEKERKTIGIWRNLIYLSVYMAVVVGSLFYQLPLEVSFIHFVILYAFVKWAYGEDYLYTLALVVVGSLVVSMIELLLMWGCFILFQVVALEESHTLLVVSMTVVLSYWISRTKIHRVMRIFEKWEFAYIIVGILSMMMFVPVIIIKIFNEFNLMDYIYIIACVLVMWLLMFRVQKYKIEAQIRRHYFDSYKKVMIQIQRRQHKIKNHINTAYSMFQVYDTYEELVEGQRGYLSKTLMYELPNDAITLEEPSIIALIYEKLNEAVEQGIQLETSFRCSMIESRVSDVIWVEIIGTLFDNAIEALGDYGEGKKIWLEIALNDSQQISVRIANTYEHMTQNEISQFFVRGYSTKGEERGIGLYHIKKLVDKYCGELCAMSDKKEGVDAVIFEVTI